MRVLVACEFSGVVRDAFIAKGHDAWSCDLLDAPGNHLQMNCLIPAYDEQWDLMIAHPPCDYLAVSGLHWNKRRPERAEKTKLGLELVAQLLLAPIEKICVENPVGCISTQICKPDQIIQPYEFGDDASKKTCLWLKNLPLLVKNPDKRCPGRLVNGKERWANQTDSGQNRLGPSPDRARLRAVTYQGIANAMADQWG